LLTDQKKAKENTENLKLKVGNVSNGLPIISKGYFA